MTIDYKEEINKINRRKEFNNNLITIDVDP